MLLKEAMMAKALLILVRFQLKLLGELVPTLLEGWGEAQTAGTNGSGLHEQE